MEFGTIKFYNREKNFGFITPDYPPAIKHLKGGQDVFFRGSAVRAFAEERIKAGSRVSFKMKVQKPQPGQAPEAYEVREVEVYRIPKVGGPEEIREDIIVLLTHIIGKKNPPEAEGPQRLGRILLKILEVGPDRDIWVDLNPKDSWVEARVFYRTWNGFSYFAIQKGFEGLVATGHYCGSGSGGWANTSGILAEMEKHLGLEVGEIAGLWWERGVAQLLADAHQMREEGL